VLDGIFKGGVETVESLLGGGTPGPDTFELEGETRVFVALVVDNKRHPQRLPLKRLLQLRHIVIIFKPRRNITARSTQIAHRFVSSRTSLIETPTILFQAL
jgi:hypothetical protein